MCLAFECNYSVEAYSGFLRNKRQKYYTDKKRKKNFPHI
jgi:hypothetical protein